MTIERNGGSWRASGRGMRSKARHHDAQFLRRGRRSITFDNAALRQTRSFDVQDGREHILRGVPLRELVALARPPRAVDAVIFVYSDGMQIPVHLADKGDVDAVFIALAHGDVRNRFSARVPLLAVTDLSEQPSLHEKIKGYTDGSMPVLNHISNAEITTLWRWLHAIHRGAIR